MAAKERNPSGSYKTHWYAAQGGANSAQDRVDSFISLEEKGGYAFRFTLPPDGLAVRSVAIVNGVPEIRFGASHKVPTITEEDVAIALRLALEGNRPEFFLLGFLSGIRSADDSSISTSHSGCVEHPFGTYYSMQTGS